MLIIGVTVADRVKIMTSPFVFLHSTTEEEQGPQTAVADSGNTACEPRGIRFTGNLIGNTLTCVFGNVLRQNPGDLWYRDAEEACSCKLASFQFFLSRTIRLPPLACPLPDSISPSVWNQRMLSSAPWHLLSGMKNEANWIEQQRGHASQIHLSGKSRKTGVPLASPFSPYFHILSRTVSASDL